MPIPVQEIVDRATAALDAEGSDRYLFDQDFKPAINYAIEWIVLVLNRAMEEDKFTGESLRELVKTSVWQANHYSRLAFNEAETNTKLWSVLAIYPNPVTAPFYAPSPDPILAKSKLIPNISYVSGKACTNRLTLEQWNDNEDNVFMPGNTKLEGALSEFAYLNFGDFGSSSYTNPGIFEITIRPSVADKLVAMAYLKKPDAVLLITDNIQFPATITNIALEKMLEYISYKQGNQTTLYAVTERDTTKLIQALS